MIGVVCGNPFESVPRIFDFEKCGRITVKFVQIPHAFRKTRVHRIIFQEKFHAFGVIPLLKLPEFRTHKVQLFPGVRHHVSEKRTHSRKLLLVFAGHFPDQRALSVHNLVVRNGQNVIFRKRIHHRKRQLVVLVLSKQRVGRNIRHHVVHPAHVPFEIKA